MAVSTEQGIAAVAKAIAEAVLIKAQGESQSAATRLESIVERLERLERSQSITGTFDTARQAPRQEAPKEAFIVHGHDLAARESVRRFLEKIGVRPIVLSEQPSHGHTVIEKLEAYSHVAFAIVLLTPDDMGGVSIPPGELGHRARQNVIFELGYFLGKLGRTRFCILNKGSLEIPSDIHGMVWIEMDPAHGWRISLASELRHAGISIDLNKVLE